MTTYPRDEAAQRAGVEPGYLDRLVELGILSCVEPGSFTAGDVCRAQLIETLEGSGIPLEGLAEGIRRGALSLAFLDTPAYERFAALSPETFRQVSERTGVPLELLTTIREAIGLAPQSRTIDCATTSRRSCRSSSCRSRRGSGPPRSSACSASPATASGGSPSRRRRGGCRR